MQARTFLFDLDGTLIDHFEAIHRCHAQTMTHFGLNPPTLAEVRNVVGGGLDNAVARLFGPAHVALVPQAVSFYRQCWPEHLLFGVRLLPGALELLRALHAAGATCAVFTNKHGPSARELCTHLGLDPFLQGVFGALDTPWLKPEREFTEHALHTLKRDASSALLVGDSPWDVKAAHNSGFPCWVVTTGTHSAAELQTDGADRVFASLPEIQTALSL